MKVLFLHISDLHLKKDTIVDVKKITKIGNVINEYQNISKIFVICSGDISYTASREEYNKAYRLLKDLKSTLSNNYKGGIEFILVPGNHDIIINENTTYNDSDINVEKLKKQIDSMHSYYNFINGWYHKQKIVLNTRYDVAKYYENVKENNISINLINTAPFSTREHNDKELHFVNPESICKIRREKGLNILVMHHSCDWFHEKVKNILEKSILENIDIMFYGHEHSQKVFKLKNSSREILISKAGAFDVNEYDNNTSFNIVLFDFHKRDATLNIYEWIKTTQMYLKVDTHKVEIMSNKPIQYNKNFINEIEEDKKNNLGYKQSEYFVFPDVRKEEKSIIKDIIELENYIFNKKYVIINGRNESGKTTLLKMLFLKLKESITTIFIDKKDINNNNIQKIISNAVEKQFSTLNAKEKFKQLKKEEKIIIIDDFDKIQKEEARLKLINYLQQHFGYIIVSGSFNDSLDIKEEFKEKYMLDMANLNIHHLTKKQRMELTRKLGKLNSFELDNKQILEIEKNIEKNPILLAMGNSFIITSIDAYIKQGGSYSSDGKMGFSVLFENSLRSAIIQNTKKIYITEYLRAIEFLARNIHFSKKSVFDDGLIEKSLTECEKVHGDEVSKRDFVNTMVDAKILKEIDTNRYIFLNKMHLAYFVAKYIVFDINNNSNYDDYKYILENICFGINDNILLFIIYLAQDMKLMISICNKANEITKDWELFSFDKKNINFLYNKTNISENITISDEEIKIKENEFIENEIENIENFKLSCEGIYDYNENDINTNINQLLCVLKCIELLARGYDSFYASLSSEQKEKIANAIFINIDKIIFNTLNKIDMVFDDFINFLSEHTEKEITKEKIEKEFINDVIGIIANLYFYYSNLCTNSQTYNLLNNIIAFDSTNLNSVIHRFSITNNTYKIDKLKEKIRDEISQLKDQCAIKIAAIIIIKGILTNNYSLSERNSLIDTFNKNTQSDLIINQKIPLIKS